MDPVIRYFSAISVAGDGGTPGEGGDQAADGDAGSAVQSRAIRRSPAGVRWSPIRGQAARLGSSQIEDDRDEDEETASQRRVQGEGGAGSAAGRS